MICGTVYGIILNDVAERTALANNFHDKPYERPPEAPVVYIKPRNCVNMGNALVPVPEDCQELEAAATIALLFGNSSQQPVAATLALDVSVPSASYYRPAVTQRCRDGFLPLGTFAAFQPSGIAQHDIITFVDDVMTHRWSLKRLVRDIHTLVTDLGSFMTLADGDLLLVGLPGDAPRVRCGQSVRVQHELYPPLAATFVADARL